MRRLILTLMALSATAFAFDRQNDAPRFDYQGYFQFQRSSLSIGSSCILSWHRVGIELEHEEGDPFEEFAATMVGGSTLEYSFYRVKGVFRLPLNRSWNCRFSAGYGGGTSTASFDTGILPLVMAIGLGYQWDGMKYSYSEHVRSGTMKVSLEKQFFRIFKAELIGGVTYYSFSDGIKQIRTVDNWTPTLALALGVRTPWGQ
ncbi:MAG: hypothetical protein MUF78_06580 [Candidatus Edwardsbacteria bacterium]|jgi:hypothetical protein|nr:hypothetical protein [Candidatus Edwardsbacteria bacterium]